MAAPAADDHIGILVDGLVQQPVDVVELVLPVGVDGDQEVGRGAGHSAFDRRAVAAIHLVMDGPQFPAEGRLVEDRSRAIPRSVIDGDQLVVSSPAMFDNPREIALERRLFVVGGDDHGERVRR